LLPVDGIQLIIAIDDVADLAVYEVFCFADEFDEIVFIDVAGKHEIDDRAVEAFGKLAYDIDLFDLAKTFDHGIHDPIEADVLEEDGMDLAIEGVVGIGLEVLPVAFRVGFQHTGLLKAVEFLANSIAGLAELGFKAS